MIGFGLISIVIALITGGAVLVKQLGGIAKFLAVSSPTFQRNHAARGGQPTHEG
jgi:hypothetical protein